jgi:hypothetical protein
VTRQAFYEAYERELEARYDWARTSASRREDFLRKVRHTVEGEGVLWSANGPAVHAAWLAIGGDEPFTLTKLRELR